MCECGRRAGRSRHYCTHSVRPEERGSGGKPRRPRRAPRTAQHPSRADATPSTAPGSGTGVKFNTTASPVPLIPRLNVPPWRLPNPLTVPSAPAVEPVTPPVAVVTVQLYGTVGSNPVPTYVASSFQPAPRVSTPCTVSLSWLAVGVLPPVFGAALAP